MTNTKLKALTGTAVPLSALVTKDSPVIGEYPSLKIFSDFARKANLGLIQLLPVNDSGTQSSPYSALSAFALHPIYLCLSEVPGFSEIYKSNGEFKKNYDAFVSFHSGKERFVYYEVNDSKDYFLRLIYAESETAKNGKLPEEIESWMKKNSWVIPYAVYKNIKYENMQASWKSWKKSDTGLSEEEILARFSDKSKTKEHLYYVWLQYLCDKQFSEAVLYARKQNILIKGDLPILMNEDSCDAWSHPEIFNQSLRAGSPQDGENPAGQNWGFPTYNWKNLKKDDYQWWKDRLLNASKYYDAYRLDHILGFFRIWAIPENDENALNGHTEPYEPVTIKELNEMGFDQNRIRWMSVPHVPTHVIEDITWNHDKAHQILQKFATKLPDEELWLLDGGTSVAKKTSGLENFGSRNIREAKLSQEGLCTEDAESRIKDILVKYWSDRTFIPVSKDKYAFSWICSQSTSWGSLNENEKEMLSKLKTQKATKEDKLWEKNATDILSSLTSSNKMIPCGEDLGANLKCLPPVMDKLEILGLRVVRWCRKWEKDGMPYETFDQYIPLSVCTTSVHDSSTMRQWYEEENEGVLKTEWQEKYLKSESKDAQAFEAQYENFKEPFSPEVAENLLKKCKKASSLWFIPPLQDFLYMNKKYWLEDAKDERINVPGSVTDFNWTYKIPCTVEELFDDDDLVEKIKKI